MAYEGFDAMFTGKPSKPARIVDQIGTGLAEGDGKGYQDNADNMAKDVNKYGLTTGGKRRKSEGNKEQ